MRILNPRFPKEKKAEIISTYLTGDNSYEELSDYYKVSAATIRGWVSRYRKRKNVVSLQAESKPVEDMARKKKEAEKSPEVLLLEARIRELETALRFEKNLGPSSRRTQQAAWPDHHCCL